MLDVDIWKRHYSGAVVVQHHTLTFDLTVVTLTLKVFCCVLVIHVQAWVIQIHTESHDHFNDGHVSLGAIPSSIQKNCGSIHNKLPNLIIIRLCLR